MKLGEGGYRGKHPCYLPNTVPKAKFLFVGQGKNTKKGIEHFLLTMKIMMMTVIKKIMMGLFHSQFPPEPIRKKLDYRKMGTDFFFFLLPYLPEFASFVP